MEKQDIHYPWHLAPDWAQWAFINADGEGRWIFTNKSLGILEDFPIRNWTPPENIDWKQSLEKRPEQ